MTISYRMQGGNDERCPVCGEPYTEHLSRVTSDSDGAQIDINERHVRKVCIDDAVTTGNGNIRSQLIVHRSELPEE